MANPSPATDSDAIRRPDLNAVAYEYIVDNIMASMVATDVFPVYPTPLKSSGYPMIPKESFLKLADDERAPDGSYNEIDWEFERGTYNCEDKGNEGKVDDTLESLYEDYFDLEEVTTEQVMTNVLLNHELRVLNMLQDTDTFTAQTVDTKWTSTSSANPASDVESQRETLQNRGINPNTLVVSRKIFRNLKVTSDVQDRVKYTEPVKGRDITADMLAGYFDVEKFLVADQIYDSADKGQAANITKMMADKYAFLCRTANNPRNLKEPCIGRTFLWTGDSPTRTVTESYRKESVRADMIRVRHNVDEAYVMTDAGILMDVESTG